MENIQINETENIQYNVENTIVVDTLINSNIKEYDAKQMLALKYNKLMNESSSKIKSINRK
jgi:hypothetical protein